MSSSIITQKYAELSTDMFAVLTKHTLTHLNPAWEKTLGTPQKNLEGINLLTITHPDDIAAATKMFSDLKNLPANGSFAFESRLLHQNKSWRVIKWQIQKDEAGDQFLCIARDITGSREAETRRFAETDFLKKLIDYLPVAVFCKDAQKNFELVVWNRVCEEWWGISEEKALGKNDYDFFPKEQADSYRAFDTATLTKGESIDIENEETFHITKGKIQCHTLKVPIPDIDGKNRFLVGISEDITERVAMQKQVEAQRTLAIASSKMATLGQMAGGMAHEINNPLAAIKIRSAQMRRILERQLGTDSESSVLKMLDEIGKTTEQIAKIIHGLRSFSRNGDTDPFETVTVQKIIDNTMALCAAQFENHNIELKIAKMPDTLTMQCRPVQISQILLNLLINAKQAVLLVPDGRLVELRVTDSKDRVQFSVVDNGPGVPANFRARIMEPFFTTKDIGEGTGLGLSISKGLAGAHHGDLFLDESKPQTTFVIDLPKVQIEV